MVPNRATHHIWEYFMLCATQAPWKQDAVVRRCSVKKVFLPATLLKKRPWHRCFPVNFAKFLRTTFFIQHLRWLLLENESYHGLNYSIEIENQVIPILKCKIWKITVFRVSFSSLHNHCNEVKWDSNAFLNLQSTFIPLFELCLPIFSGFRATA